MFPQELEIAIFRIVQECLTNIHRHSGSKAAKIRITRRATARFAWKWRTEAKAYRQRSRKQWSQVPSSELESGDAQESPATWRNLGYQLWQPGDGHSRPAAGCRHFFDCQGLKLTTINNGKAILCVDDEAIGLTVRKMLLELVGSGQYCSGDSNPRPRRSRNTPLQVAFVARVGIART